MLNDKPDNVSSQDELTRIRHCLMGEPYSHLSSIPFVLRLIEDMLAEPHTSGHPDPHALAMIASVLREEKFKERREKQGNTPLSSDIQILIDRLKTLKTRAMLAHPEKVVSSSWASQPWDSHDATTPFPVFTITYLLLNFILLTTVYFADISDDAKIIILSTYFISSTVIAFLIKKTGLLAIIFTSVLTTLIYYSHSTLSLFK